MYCEIVAVMRQLQQCAVAVPGNFHDVLMHYTAQGHRVIGLAYKPLTSLSYVKVQRARRLVQPTASVSTDYSVSVLTLYTF